MARRITKRKLAIFACVVIAALGTLAGSLGAAYQELGPQVAGAVAVFLAMIAGGIMALAEPDPQEVPRVEFMAPPLLQLHAHDVIQLQDRVSRLEATEQARQAAVIPATRVDPDVSLQDPGEHDHTTNESADTKKGSS